MISNRRGRSTAPIETVREFAVNTTKGIDITRAPVDLSTVPHAKNLINNPDGSLSLRKPIVAASPSDLTKVDREKVPLKMFNGKYLRWYEDKHNKILYFPGYVCVKYYTYDGTVSYTSVGDTYISILDSCPTLINLNTSTILANVNVKLSSLEGLVDTSLYDDDVEYLPRYLKIVKEKGAVGTATYDYLVEVLNPEPNELRFGTDGDFALNPNLVLDNPYAIRDTYGSVYPEAKGILGYVYSTRTLYETVSIPFDYTSYDYTVNYTSPAMSKSIDVTAISTVKTAPTERTIVFDTFTDTGLIFNCALTLKLHTEYIDQKTRLYVEITGKCYGSSKTYLRVDEGSVAYSAADTPISVKVITYDKSNVMLTTVPFSAYFSQYSTTLGDESGNPIELPTYSFTTSYGSDNPGYVDSLPEEYHHATITIGLPKGMCSYGGSFKGALAASSLPVETVSQLTASSKNTRFRIANSVATSDVLVLKAFGSLPSDTQEGTYWATWYATYDGINWYPMLYPAFRETTEYRMVNASGQSPQAMYFKIHCDEAGTLTPDGMMFENRPDILILNPYGTLRAKQYKFKIVSLKESSDGLSDAQVYDIDSDVTEAYYTPIESSTTALATLDFANAVYGKKLYHKKRIYSYGHEKFFNNIFVTGIDNYETPLYNVIDLDAKNAARVTSLIPWRDYLISATENAIYLHTPQDDGYLTKTVTTSLGIPEQDSRCCVSILNGVIAKSGPRVYLIYPNTYAGTDSVLNVADISAPVSEYLQGPFEDCFAFSTEREYILMMAAKSTTSCLRYDYTTRIWNYCEYPTHLYDYHLVNVETIILFGKYVDTFTYYDVYDFDVETAHNADKLYVPKEDSIKDTPISFEWDSGQKTDNMASKKRFVESKLIFTTEDETENFPMQLTVAVDGDPHVTVVDVNTDAPLLKTDDSIGVLNTSVRLGGSSIGHSDKGLVRQLVVRYSGKGRSIRHILTGSARSPFRFYEAYVRYKLLDNRR